MVYFQINSGSNTPGLHNIWYKQILKEFDKIERVAES